MWCSAVRCTMAVRRQIAVYCWSLQANFTLITGLWSGWVMQIQIASLPVPLLHSIVYVSMMSSYPSQSIFTLSLFCYPLFLWKEPHCKWHLTATFKSSSHSVFQITKQTFYVHLCSVIFLAPLTQWYLQMCRNLLQKWVKLSYLNPGLTHFENVPVNAIGICVLPSLQ